MEFRELVKLIHPDTNPDIKDAGEKMAQAKLFRNNPIRLLSLATKWGVLPMFYGLGDSVTVNLDGHYIYGVIVDIVKQYYTHNLIILNLKNQNILIVAHVDMSKKHDYVTTIGKADDDLWKACRTMYDLYKEGKKRNSTVRRPERPRPVYERVYINPNCVYNDGTEAHISTRDIYGWYRVTKTTARRVYFYSPSLGRETYTNIDNVVRGRMR